MLQGDSDICIHRGCPEENPAIVNVTTMVTWLDALWTALLDRSLAAGSHSEGGGIPGPGQETLLLSLTRWCEHQGSESAVAIVVVRNGHPKPRGGHWTKTVDGAHPVGSRLEEKREIECWLYYLSFWGKPDQTPSLFIKLNSNYKCYKRRECI